MKKIIITLFILITTLCYVNSAELKVTPPQWADILPQKATYNYREPIVRPKWAYPLAWTACICTLGLAQIPNKMHSKDNNITWNNRQYRKYEKVRHQFDTDIKNCEIVYKNNKELSGCYMSVKQHYQLLLNSMISQDIEEEKNDLIEEQNQLIRIQNSLIDD